MHIVDNQASIVAEFMRGLSELFEGEAFNHNRIMYQAVIGWDPNQVGERCRAIDAANCHGVVAIFDPATIERGPVIVGVSLTDRTWSASSLDRCGHQNRSHGARD